MNEGGNSLGYQYKGLPLTAASIQTLILELLAGATKERQEIADEVLRVHLQRGGVKSKADHLNAVKKALADLKEIDAAENPSLGYWRITGSSASDAASGEKPAEEVTGSEDATTDDVESSAEQVADVELGSGPGAIYLYYLPTYRLRAEERGEKVWPCKIGRTDRDPLQRVLAQASTALPELPHVALVLRTPFPLAWESVLHGVLTLRGSRMDKSPGTEWFLTSPDEVVDIIRANDPRLVLPAMRTSTRDGSETAEHSV
jgi:hypothetical protein